MGRTNPTFRNVLEAVKGRWADYRRALRRRDQPHFDRLFEHADAHADASGYLNPDDPMNPILVSMLLEHERRVAALEAEVEALEAGDGDDGGVDGEGGGEEGEGDGEDGDAGDGVDSDAGDGEDGDVDDGDVDDEAGDADGEEGDVPAAVGTGSR